MHWKLTVVCSDQKVEFKDLVKSHMSATEKYQNVKLNSVLASASYEVLRIRNKNHKDYDVFRRYGIRPWPTLLKKWWSADRRRTCPAQLYWTLSIFRRSIRNRVNRNIVVLEGLQSLHLREKRLGALNRGWSLKYAAQRCATCMLLGNISENGHEACNA